MAGSSLLVLLDDIAAVLDDVSLMTKVAAKKTAGVLGDDLAVNAEKVTGVRADRELPVVWAVAKGSFRNKLILVPSALLIGFIAPWAISPLLMMGGMYLCYEGFEKVIESLFHKDEVEREHRELLEHLADPDVDPVAYERDKIKGAIRTDFILSAEIIVISMGIAAASSFTVQVMTLAGIAVIMTVGVYGLVAGIVKLDDAGLYLTQKQGSGAGVRFMHWLGYRLLAFAPLLMKSLTVIGTVAMFLVGGGILVHGLHVFDSLIEAGVAASKTIDWVGPVIAALFPTLVNAFIGVLAGGLVLAVVSGAASLRSRGSA